MKQLEPLLGIEKHLAMFVQPMTFETVAAFMDGYDYALGGSPLRGFREWLSLRHGRGMNMHWPGQICFELFGSKVTATTDQESQRALAYLFSALHAFNAEVTTDSQLLEVLVKHRNWGIGKYRPRRKQVETRPSESSSKI